MQPENIKLSFKIYKNSAKLYFMFDRQPVRQIEGNSLLLINIAR